MARTPVILLFTIAGLIACNPSKKASKSASSAQTESSNPSFSKPQAELMDANTFKLTGVSEDASYGYNEKNPIKVGGSIQGGAANERRYLNALLGPNGETIQYVRRGSCCMFKTDNGMNGYGLLDAYEVKYQGLDKPIVLYVDMYDYGYLKAPKGFTFKGLAEKG